MATKTEAKKTTSEQAKPQSRDVAAFHNVENWLAQNVDEVVARLPKHINKDRFNAAALEAVRQNPKLLMCTPRSLFNAFRKAATDGLLPDGREGVITPYKDEAQWNPMVWGLRKRARELDGIIVDAQVVYKEDTEGHGIIWDQGDEPKIVHRPTPLGQTKGAKVGVYAIFKQNGEILHREVMDAGQVAAVRAQSKAPDSLMWTKFEEEGWKKAVVRRGFKSVPCSEKLEEIIKRDNEAFELSDDAPPPRPAASRPAGVSEMLDQIGGPAVIEGTATDVAPHLKEGNAPGGLRYDDAVSASNLEMIKSSLADVKTPEELRELVEGYAPHVARMTPNDAGMAQVALAMRASAILDPTRDPVPSFLEVREGA